MDWASFRQAVEEQIPNDSSHLCISARIAVFNDMLIDAGNSPIGKTKPSQTKFAMNPKVKALVQKRNKLKKDIATKRAEWVEANRDARRAREEAKEEARIAFVESLEEDDDAGKVWRVIKSLDGAPTSSAPNEALCFKGKTITSNKAKADTFAKHYASVSSLQFTKVERDEIRSTKQHLNAPGPDYQSCNDFSMR